MNDGQIPNPNVVRTAPGTRYHRVEGNRRASRNGRVSDLPPETPHVYYVSFYDSLTFASLPAGGELCGSEGACARARRHRAAGGGGPGETLPLPVFPTGDYAYRGGRVRYRFTVLPPAPSRGWFGSLLILRVFNNSKRKVLTGFVKPQNQVALKLKPVGGNRERQNLTLPHQPGWASMWRRRACGRSPSCPMTKGLLKFKANVLTGL